VQQPSEIGETKHCNSHRFTTYKNSFLQQRNSSNQYQVHL